VRYKAAKELRGFAVVADDGGDEFLSFRTGRDVVRGVYRARLPKRGVRVSSRQPDKKTVEQNRGSDNRRSLAN
jgi:hypothetical protein